MRTARRWNPPSASIPVTAGQVDLAEHIHDAEEGSVLRRTRVEATRRLALAKVHRVKPVDV